MLGRPGSPRSRAVGRYDLVVELAKSQLGPLWAATTSGDTGPALRMVRRISLPSAAGQTGKGALITAARWSVDFATERALSVLDIVEDEEELAIVSSFVPGETLRSLLRLSNFKREPISARVALRILLDICHAFSAAEIRAVSSPLGPDFIYGSLLPDSILVGTDGTTRLTDIGVAAVWRRLPGAPEHAEITAYSAPEQLSGAPSDARSDLFILGTLLWEMLSGGKRLFVGSSHRAVAEKVCQHPINPISPCKPGESVPPVIEGMVSRLLERDPRRRFRSVGDLIETIESLDAVHVALPVEVSDFLTTFAHSALTLRERVLDRALQRPPHPPARVPPEPQGQEPQAEPDPPRRERPSPDIATPEPTGIAPETAPATAAATPERPVVAPLGARPLPLPAQAKLGSRISAPEGMLPPPPMAQSSIKVPPPPRREPDPKQDAQSVRAADILRALAVEDAPASDELPTLPPAMPEEAPDAPFEAPMPTIAGQTPATAPLASPKPPAESVDSELIAAPALASSANTPGVPDPSARASDEAIVGLPTRQSTWGQRRFPVSLVAGVGGGLLLIAGLVFALGTGGSTEPEAATEPEMRETAETSNAAVDAKARKPAAADVQSTPPPTQVPKAPAQPSNQATVESASADTQTDEPTPQPDSAKAVAPPVQRPIEPSGQAVPPARQSSPAKAPPRKLRAKRTFIPSGI